MLLGQTTRNAARNSGMERARSMAAQRERLGKCYHGAMVVFGLTGFGEILETFGESF